MKYIDGLKNFKIYYIKSSLDERIEIDKMLNAIVDFMRDTKNILYSKSRKNDYNKIYSHFENSQSYKIIIQYLELLNMKDLKMNEGDFQEMQVGADLEDKEWYADYTLVSRNIKENFRNLVKFETLTRSFNKTFTKRLMPQFIKDRIFIPN